MMSKCKTCGICFPLSKFELTGSVTWCCMVCQFAMNELLWKFLVAYVIKDSELLLINQDSRPVCVCFMFLTAALEDHIQLSMSLKRLKWCLYNRENCFKAAAVKPGL